MSVDPLIRRQVRAGRLKQTIYVEKRNPLPRRLFRQTLQPHGGDDQIRDPNTSRTSAQEQYTLILEVAFFQLERAVQACDCYATGALNVVVVAGDLVDIASQEANGVRALPVLEVDSAPRIEFLDSVDEFLDEGIELLW